MKVILTKKVPNLGQTGDVKEVSDGYARNFLIPQKLCRVASKQVVAEMENIKNQQKKSESKKSKQLKEVFNKLNNLKIILKAKADDKKTLFAAISVKNIAEELKNRGYEVDAKYIKLDQPIKSLGSYEIKINFDDDTGATVGLTVTRED